MRLPVDREKEYSVRLQRRKIQIRCVLLLVVSSAAALLLREEARAQTQRTGRVEVELVTVTTRGFEPKQISRPSGRILLSVQNRSGIKEVWLRLDAPGNARLHETRVSRTKLDWSTFVDFGPWRLHSHRSSVPELDVPPYRPLERKGLHASHACFRPHATHNRGYVAAECVAVSESSIADEWSGCRRAVHA